MRHVFFVVMIAIGQKYVWQAPVPKATNYRQLGSDKLIASLPRNALRLLILSATPCDVSRLSRSFLPQQQVWTSLSTNGTPTGSVLERPQNPRRNASVCNIIQHVLHLSG
jgi:hypothetical protein